ncbi:ROK family protein [Peribacillus psychrosaccharolyticus]|uniref:fructokinase n=1 Tax=Peribacillus psychrosaccharolyticus TaxID=1407 RepID=A0A974NQJ0_PERPY|nr:ROK family protein [Peribacillus psychrosaccharolyticus]MEC2057777.1 ROK family protein [Peribacillus psychrosaccharolyticus]MED3746303.1 ROK family protein [Peribacillus psychrosaccharolyticus]QQT01898.1 ROK family protein [Peribacillus psychrosaccharolyticus]
MALVGGIEAGGTKFVCAIGDHTGEIRERVEIPTTFPAETMEEVIRFFHAYDIEALGIGSFGPIDVNRESPTYGFITSTPKQGWINYPIVSKMKEHFNVPIGFHTDVNAAALGEGTYGAAKGLDSCLYMTIGTGIGAGALVGGKLLQGHSHPEMGHILIRRHPEDYYQGKCPYHIDCFEGLAAGPAIEARYGMKANELEERSDVWELEAYYIAQALMNFILILSPQKIILGGGVMKQQQVFPKIRKQLETVLKGYVDTPNLQDYIVSPGLGNNSGIIGSLILAQQALHGKY